MMARIMERISPTVTRTAKSAHLPAQNTQIPPAHAKAATPTRSTTNATLQHPALPPPAPPIIVLAELATGPTVFLPLIPSNLGSTSQDRDIECLWLLASAVIHFAISKYFQINF